jgi:3-oxoacyl-[acyl-carrier protein] reductase
MSDRTKGFADKFALVTGGTGGIGSAIARAFLREGVVVGVHYKENVSSLQRLVEAARSWPGEIVPIVGDLLDKKTRESLVDQFCDITGGIDILINNAAGIDRYVSFFDSDENDWLRCFELNLIAPVALSKRACHRMKERHGGRIINITTAAINYGGINSVHYVSSKASLEYCALALSKWGAKHNILVNTVRCGLIDTGMRGTITGYTDEDFQKRRELVPLGRAGTPEEVASIVQFLSSEAAQFVTGEVWTVAGGD